MIGIGLNIRPKVVPQAAVIANAYEQRVLAAGGTVEATLCLRNAIDRLL